MPVYTLGYAYLVCHDPSELWVAMAQSIDRNTRCKVEVFPVLDIVES